jgi:hypothetical protein
MSSQITTQKANNKQSNESAPANQATASNEKKRTASAKASNGGAQQSSNPPKTEQNKARQDNRDQGKGHQYKQEQHRVEHNDSTKETTFHFESSSAKSVLLAGDFSEWDKAPIHMIRGGGNVWHAKVALAPGRHAYRFVVDGEWQNDPNKERIPNSFGTFNNVMDV